MQKFSLSKGFTLIELLVVIAILGILAAVVLIAINPAERIKESQDTQVRSDISTLASAIEACFTSVASGTYASCDTTGELQSGGFLKTAPKTAVVFDGNTGLTELVVNAPLQARSAWDDPAGADCTSSPVYYTYNTTNGSSAVFCTSQTI